MPAFARLLLLVLMTTLAGCIHDTKDQTTPQLKGAPAALAGCCGSAPAYPGWLIALADPFAPLVGRTIALVEFRKGHLAERPDAHGFILRRLQPLDIVLVSSDNRLTGTAIPGLFSHTTIYLGTEKQLRRLGAWNEPFIAPHRDAIRAGKVFIEADKKGVHLSLAEGVFDTDKAMVLRPRVGGPSCRRKALLRYFEHIGSRFDFRFNAAEGDRLFCAELVHHILPELDLPAARLYGRDTIIPDVIAAAGLSRGTRLGFVAYVRGRRDGWESASASAAINDIAAAWRR
ncbi:MAG: YiiX/YebB-like N1pC/P60 family cysteine hydrolase [Mesorhizobium sp.]|nr:YiiX/YebB-like N1pC/P60 family cysteine hydrolase [Mesorhizobium sp.]